MSANLRLAQRSLSRLQKRFERLDEEKPRLHCVRIDRWHDISNSPDRPEPDLPADFQDFLRKRFGQPQPSLEIDDTCRYLFFGKRRDSIDVTAKQTGELLLDCPGLLHRVSLDVKTLDPLAYWFETVFQLGWNPPVGSVLSIPRRVWCSDGHYVVKTWEPPYPRYLFMAFPAIHPEHFASVPTWWFSYPTDSIVEASICAIDCLLVAEKADWQSTSRCRPITSKEAEAVTAWREHGTMTAAADAINATRQALTKAIQRAESKLSNLVLHVPNDQQPMPCAPRRKVEL